MNIRFALAAEVDSWNTHILANPDGGNILQSDEFAQQKKLTGWTPRYLMAGDIALTIHEKSVFGLGKLWYIPKGPGVTTVPQVRDIVPALRAFAVKNGVFAIKIDPELPKTDDAVQAFRDLGLTPAPYIQPNISTVLLDLSPDLDTILNNLNQKGRHAIRRAERDGVTVERVPVNDSNCHAFYDLLAQTAGSQGFANSLRPYEYYQKFWQRFADARLGQMFFAYHDGQLVAGAFALVFGDKSTYKDGASKRVEGAYGVTHFVQWHVMQWAKEQGSFTHDLCGSPPSSQIDNPAHPWYGVGLFKTSFNKQVTDYVGTFDIVVKPQQYKWWIKFGERAAKRLWWRKHHESWY